MIQFSEMNRQLIVKALAYAIKAVRNIDLKLSSPIELYDMEMLLKSFALNKIELRLVGENARRKLSLKVYVRYKGTDNQKNAQDATVTK